MFLCNKNRLRNKGITKARIIEGNVLDFQQLKEAIQGQDIVYANWGNPENMFAKPGSGQTQFLVDGFLITFKA